MSYIDGFVAAAPTANKAAYLNTRRRRLPYLKTMAQLSLLRLVECWGDDVPQGNLNSMPMAVQCRAVRPLYFRGSCGRHVRCVTAACRPQCRTHASTPQNSRCPSIQIASSTAGSGLLWTNKLVKWLFVTIVPQSNRKPL